MKQTFHFFLFFLASIAFGNTETSEQKSLLDNFTLHSSVGFESEYVYEGSKQAGPSTQFEIFGDQEVGEGTIRGGIWGNLPFSTKHDTFNEFNFYGNYFYPITEMFTAEVGYKHAWFSNVKSRFLGQYNEIDLSFIADVDLSPKASFAYNFTKRQYKFQLAAGYEIDLSDYIVQNLSWEIGGYVGILRATRAYGGVRGTHRKNGYMYAGIDTDLVYKIDENSDIRFGVRYAMNDDGCAGVANERGAHGKMLWWGGSLNFQF